MDWGLYSLYNNDLQHMNEEQLIQHYLMHGRHENRKYRHELPLDFEPHIYRQMNDDLSELSDEELKKHYTLYGREEQRSFRLTDKPNRKVTRKSITDIKLAGLTCVII